MSEDLNSPQSPSQQASTGAAPSAESNTSESPEISEEQRQEMIENYQRDVMERVPTLQEECHLGKVSDFCRISDLHNPKFKAAGERERLQQQQLVQFAAEAIDNFYDNGRFDMDGAKAIVYAFITAANNNLYPTHETEAFFGVEIPTLESLLQGCSLVDENKPASLDIDERKQFEESTFGLLIWRTWKILIRTPEGREVLLAELLAQCEEEAERLNMLHSYSAVEAVIVEGLMQNTLRDKFIEWTKNLPVSHVMQNRCLMPREKKFILDSLRSGEPVEWLKSIRKGFK